MKAILRKTRISPKKANLIAGMVRKKNVQDALNILKFTPKKGAKIIYKVLYSAASNAKNNFKQPFEDLVITKILVTKGPTYKRSIPISRGRVHPIAKRTSHITVEVGLDEGEEDVEDVDDTKKGIKKEDSAKKDIKDESKEVKVGKEITKTIDKKTDKSDKK